MAAGCRYLDSAGAAAAAKGLQSGESETLARAEHRCRLHDGDSSEAKEKKSARAITKTILLNSCWSIAPGSNMLDVITGPAPDMCGTVEDG
eukprot:3792054-Rhodomonas_salina.3